VGARTRSYRWKSGAAALAAFLAGCAPAERPREDEVHAAVELFLASLAADNASALRACLVRADADEHRWRPSAFRGARTVAVEIEGERALAVLAPADARAELRTLVLRREDGTWRIALGESLRAWVEEPFGDGALLARP
jgi:hypothetical protein